MSEQEYEPLMPILKTLGFECEISHVFGAEHSDLELDQIVESFFCKIPRNTKTSFLERTACYHFGTQGYQHDVQNSKKDEGNIKLEGDNRLDIWIDPITEKKDTKTINFTIYATPK